MKSYLKQGGSLTLEDAGESKGESALLTAHGWAEQASLKNAASLVEKDKLHQINRRMDKPLCYRSLFKNSGHKMIKYSHSTSGKGVNHGETLRNGDS